MQKVIFKLKLNLKGIINTLIQVLSIFAFAWFNDCILEMSIIYICFFVFRKRFEKQYHARTTWLCTLYTIIIFYIVSNISPNIAMSILLIIIFTYSINFISFYVRDYFDLRDRFKANKVEIRKGMSKDKLINLCELSQLTELETKILTYYYCDRLTLTAISYKVDYSYDSVYLIKSKAIKKINNVLKDT